MRILYLDLDSLRPDHLGCYGYQRNTSPHIDRLAQESVRFENCYASDAPCLPSRTALWSGRFGIHNGVVSHGGAAAQLTPEGSARGFRDRLARSSWMSVLQSAGYRTATVSSFGARHAAWHWYAGYQEIMDPGGLGEELAHQVAPPAIDWLKRNARRENWFLHVNFWDAHTPYRTPAGFGDPFAGDPLPGWLDEGFLRRCWEGYGPHSAREPNGYPHSAYARQAPERYPRVPRQLDSMAQVRRWIDGYDTGIRYADHHVGQLLETLDEAGVLGETAVVLSADHGESQGECNVWGDHHLADSATCRVPLIVRWPGVTEEGRVDRSLHYQLDWGATMLELAGARVPPDWDGQPFMEAFVDGREQGREFLVLSQGAWACQRGVRFDRGDQAYLYLRTYHAGHKDLAPHMLFNLSQDPHQQQDLAGADEDGVAQAVALLTTWGDRMLATNENAVDPMEVVIAEGGPFHTRGRLPRYLDHLRDTGRGHHADRLTARYPDEVELEND